MKDRQQASGEEAKKGKREGGRESREAARRRTVEGMPGHGAKLGRIFGS